MLTFASFPVGLTGTLPPKIVTREETIAFAREFDPQPFHLDDAAAAGSILGGISASGWHTCAMLMRMICDGYLNASTSQGSPGVKEVRWLKPVKPGDRLTASYEVREARQSKSRPDIGICQIFFTVRRDDGQAVMTLDCTMLFGLTAEPPPPPGAPAARRQDPPALAAPGRLGSASVDGQSSAGDLYLEDYEPGQNFNLGTYQFTAPAIMAFARDYDPQPFHLDEAAAQRSVFGGLCASGWHTAALWMKLMVAFQTKAVTDVLARGAKPGRLGPSPGFVDMRWLEPVRPGDALTYWSQAQRVEDWPGRPNWGLLVMANGAHNQHGRVVFSFQGRVLVERRIPVKVEAG